MSNVPPLRIHQLDESESTEPAPQASVLRRIMDSAVAVYRVLNPRVPYALRHVLTQAVMDEIMAAYDNAPNRTPDLDNRARIITNLVNERFAALDQRTLIEVRMFFLEKIGVPMAS